MTKLSVNLNKIALLRNQRDIGIPNVMESARTVIRAGAYGVTVHPRPDERHIRYTDAYELAELIKSEYDNIEYNIEGNPFTGRHMDIMRDVRPDQATLVPDEHGANTSDHGWNLNQANIKRLVPVIEELKGLDIRVSLFMDPAPESMKTAKELGADRIELYTEPYARAFMENDNVTELLALYTRTARSACDLGLGVNAGHDLNLKNLGLFCKTVPDVLEVSIGHALIADALEMGLLKAVREYLKILPQK
ncbi:MAG: pyridoxine 5'-phosphate synthase [Candidatus Brocadiia bacterium]|nr:MAG: pyridoxine 5'-phosphate synthase [Candidatus Brocadiia bacterium]